uniref:Transmembrane protein n=1 Tax=Medicago truncatula TaxID=3880 RepID=I3S3M9_MEDTR|nr:unknown [Medicago truncatula]
MFHHFQHKSLFFLPIYCFFLLSIVSFSLCYFASSFTISPFTSQILPFLNTFL